MDINQLFNRSEPVEQKRIDVISDITAKPLVDAIKRHAVGGELKLTEQSEAVCANRLLQGAVEFALIPVSAYAYGKGNFQVLPDIAISFSGPAGNMQLFFNKELNDIETIAVDKRAHLAFHLVQILMTEKYKTTPDYVIMEPDLPAMLEKDDAALLTGEQAISAAKENPHRLDLGEEWFDLTGLPLVYAFWAGAGWAFHPQKLQQLRDAQKLTAVNLKNICKAYAENHSMYWTEYHAFLSEYVNYKFENEEKAALAEFYRYAFYLGVIDHIPELHFYEF